MSTDNIVCVVGVVDTTPLVGSPRCGSLEVVHGSSELSGGMSRSRR